MPCIKGVLLHRWRKFLGCRQTGPVCRCGGQVPREEYDYYGAYADEGAWRLYGNSATQQGADLPASVAKHGSHPYAPLYRSTPF